MGDLISFWSGGKESGREPQGQTPRQTAASAGGLGAHGEREEEEEESDEDREEDSEAEDDEEDDEGSSEEDEEEDERDGAEGTITGSVNGSAIRGVNGVAGGGGAASGGGGIGAGVAGMPSVARQIEDVELHEEAVRSYVSYAMSVIVGRALPDVRDGLKPVHRRIL